MKKILVIVGPTASGKSDLAILLAKKYNGEIISADSRQVYRGMDIGSGKVTRDFPPCHPELVEGSALSLIDSSTRKLARNDVSFYSEGIRHHLLDIASPKRSYNVTHFIRDAKKALEDIKRRGKLPIICGGTSFWIQALIEGTTFPEVKPDLELRKKLEKKTAAQLFAELGKKDSCRAKTIDPHNKIRLIRALEIIETLGKVPKPTPYHSPCEIPPLADQQHWISQGRQPTTCLIIGINLSKEILQENIRKRLEKRLKQGMVKEIEKLRKESLSWKRLESFGLEYKNVALLLQGKITKEEMKENILKESWQYVKRQLTWLRRWEKQGTKIDWAENSQTAEQITEKALF